MNAVLAVDERREMLALLEERERRDSRRRARVDLFYLLTEVLGRKDIKRPWLEERCAEVQASPNGHLDLWAREHYKSTIITFGKTIQDILASHGDDPLPEWNGREATIGIFSHTRPIAKGFLRQIKLEFERNQRLHALFPDIFWGDTRKAPKWSEDDGIVVKRKSNPKEATVEAWGLVDGQPTSKHFLVMVYDDIVTRESVTSPEMIAKTTSALELSYNLGTDGGVKRFIGTRFRSARCRKARGTKLPFAFSIRRARAALGRRDSAGELQGHPRRPVDGRPPENPRGPRHPDRRDTGRHRP